MVESRNACCSVQPIALVVVHHRRANRLVLAFVPVVLGKWQILCLGMGYMDGPSKSMEPTFPATQGKGPLGILAPPTWLTRVQFKQEENFAST